MQDGIRTISNNLETLREEISNEKMNGSVDDSDLMIRIAKLQDEEASETLILIHTYNKQNLLMLKSRQDKIALLISTSLHKNNSMMSRIYDDIMAANSKFFTVKRIPYIVGAVIAVTVSIGISHAVAPEATDYALSIFSNSFSAIKNYLISPFIPQPASI